MAAPKTKMIGEFLTYDVLEDELAKSRRQIQRMIRDHSFPEASFYLGQTPYWRKQRIQDFIAELEQRQGTSRVDLNRVGLEMARQLMANSISMSMDEPLDPENVAIIGALNLTEEQYAAIQRRDNDIRAEFLAKLDVDRAMVAVAAFFPQLRSALKNVASNAVRHVLNDERLIRPNIRIISDFFRVFELQSRLTEFGLEARAPGDVLEHFAEFDVGRSTVIAAWLLPALRPMLIAGCAHQSDADLFSDNEMLVDAGKAALNDTTWSIKQAELMARRQNRDGGDVAEQAEA